jgi:hypothetical protein
MGCSESRKAAQHHDVSRLCPGSQKVRHWRPHFLVWIPHSVLADPSLLVMPWNRPDRSPAYVNHFSSGTCKGNPGRGQTPLATQTGNTTMSSSDSVSQQRRIQMGRQDDGK